MTDNDTDARGQRLEPAVQTALDQMHAATGIAPPAQENVQENAHEGENR